MYFPLPFLVLYVHQLTKSLDNVNFKCLNVGGEKKDTKYSMF